MRVGADDMEIDEERISLGALGPPRASPDDAGRGSCPREQREVSKAPD